MPMITRLVRFPDVKAIGSVSSFLFIIVVRLLNGTDKRTKQAMPFDKLYNHKIWGLAGFSKRECFSQAEFLVRKKFRQARNLFQPQQLILVHAQVSPDPRIGHARFTQVTH